MSNDGKTRFNPNLYKNGYVCLSVLNTWNGEGWSSCQSIYSILLSLLSILNENPLINEPGYTSTHKNVVVYNNIIKYRNIEFTILKFIKYIINTNIDNNKDYIIDKDSNSLQFLNIFKKFYKNILLNFNNNTDNLLNIISNDKLFDDNFIYCSTYNLRINNINKNKLTENILNYKSLIEKFNIIEKLNIIENI